MIKRVLVPIAHGTEELEAVTIIDILRRAQLQVCVSKVSDHNDNSLLCKMSRGVIVQADCQV
jgi:4-methyl-5(b-hydroxyethyl)-thiazole monophosphate biosynthesis